MSEEDRAFRASIDTLTKRQRQVLALRCQQGLDRAETAERLSVSLDAVRNHTNGLLKRLGLSKGVKGAMPHVCWRLGRVSVRGEA